MREGDIGETFFFIGTPVTVRKKIILFLSFLCRIDKQQEKNMDERPPLSKSRSTSSSFQQGRRPSRSSKYGSIVEERKHRNTDNEEESDEQQEARIFEIPEEDEHSEMARQRGLSTERMSMNSFDHEITLKERQDVTRIYDISYY